jgi:hypothetical protein
MGLLGLIASSARAVDQATFRCEDQSIVALRKFTDARVACLLKCWRAQQAGATDRVCVDDADPNTPPMLDPTTLACTQKTETKYIAAAIKACPSGTYPTCGTYPPGPLDHAQREIASNAALVDAFTVPLILCDPLQAKCEKRALRRVEQFQKNVETCFSECAWALHVLGDSSRQCVPYNNTLQTLDPATQSCIAAAKSVSVAKITRACPTLPSCGLYAQGVAAIPDFELTYFIVGASVAGVGPYCAP